MRNKQGIMIRIGNSVGDNDNQATKNNVQEVGRSIALIRLMADLQQYQERQARRFNGS